MPTDNDLFSEEKTMVAMSFGEHIEELRARLILALLGLMVGVVMTFIPGLNLGKRIMTKMEEPAKGALTEFYTTQAKERAKEAKDAGTLTPSVQANIPADALIEQLRKIAPDLNLPPAEKLKDQTVSLPIIYGQDGMIEVVNKSVRPAS